MSSSIVLIPTAWVSNAGSSPDNGAGDYHGDLASLEDEFLPPFKAFQVDGEAEGIMFSISARSRSCANDGGVHASH